MKNIASNVFGVIIVSSAGSADSASSLQGSATPSLMVFLALLLASSSWQKQLYHPLIGVRVGYKLPEEAQHLSGRYSTKVGLHLPLEKCIVCCFYIGQQEPQSKYFLFYLLAF